MYYTIYKTTNKINNKIYIGSHKTKNPNDSYLGSGKHLIRAIELYGIYNFTKEVMYVYDNSSDMFAKEKEIVNEEFIKREDTYNIKLGGFGGFDHIDNTGRPMPDHVKKYISDYRKTCTKENNSFYGKKHTDESKKLIGESSKQRGKKQYEERISKGNHPNNFVDCPHCGKHGQLRALRRWHFNNCPSLKISR